MPKVRCKQCREYFDKDECYKTPMAWFCCVDHAVEFSKEKRAKDKLKAIEKRKKEQKKNDRIRKEKLKTARDYVKDAQKAFNRYIRIRDSKKPCVSCLGNSNDNDLLVGSRWDCGHMYSVGARSNLRFNVFNVAKQCVRCNRELSGNALNFRLEQINRIGLERVERLDNDRTVKKYSIDYLIRIKKIFTRKGNLYERRFRKLP